MFEMISTENIPMMVISPIDFKAGCFAKMSTPIPMRVVIAEIKIPTGTVVSEILTCEECGTQFAVDQISETEVVLFEAPAVEEDWGE